MHTYKVTYDGYALHDYGVINQIHKRLQPSKDNQFQRTNVQNGATFVRATSGQQIVEIDMTIKHDVLHNIDELNKILSVRDPKRLVIEDQPERYLLCILDGEVLPTSRRRASKLKLRFISPDSSWRSTARRDGAVFSLLHNTGIIDNKGTAETYPTYYINFLNDCGYFALIGPNGLISLGNPDEVDTIKLPPSEYAMNEEMHELSGWKLLTDAYKEFGIDNLTTVNSLPSTNQWGAFVNTSMTTDESTWQGHLYSYDFEQGEYDQTAQDFKLESRIDIYDANSDPGAVTYLYMTVFDEQDNGIMGIGIIDSLTNKNELEVHITSVSNGNLSLKQTAKLPRINGRLVMEKSGNLLTYSIIHEGNQGSTMAPIGVGDTVYIKDTAVYGYRYNDTRYTVKDFTRGRAYKVTRKRVRQGKNQFEIAFQGTVVYWMFEEDLRTDKVVNQGTRPQTVRRTIYNSEAGQARAAKVKIYHGVWGSSPAYSHSIINSVKVQRIYGTTYRDVQNTFRRGDNLVIDTENGEIRFNGGKFRGEIDVDSRFFPVDGGKTELAFVVSDWADSPIVVADYESRWY